MRQWRSARVAGAALIGVVVFVGCGGGGGGSSDAGADGGLPFAVSLTVPDDGAGAVPVGTTIQIGFTRAVDASTPSVQATFGPCDPSASVQISHDGFSTCVGGEASMLDPSTLTIVPRGSVLEEQVQYRIRVSSAVTDTEGTPLSAEYVQATGFRTISPPCTAVVDGTAHGATGAACVAAELQDNGDGTVTDRANHLLWARCTLAGDGTLRSGVGFGCEDVVPAEDAMTWERAVERCDDLELAGRSDWTLPDIARLKTLLVPGNTPAIDGSAFPHTSDAWYNSATSYTDPAARWAALFGYMGYAGPGYGGKLAVTLAFTRCVAGVRPAGPPVLNAIQPWYTTTSAIAFFTPSYRVAVVPTPTRQAYVGLDGSIGIVGATVVGALRGPIALGDTADSLEVTGLASSTRYRIIVVADDGLGSSSSELVMRTGDAAPALATLALSYGADGIDLAQPSFLTAGTPAPTVEAYIGIDGVISVSGATVSGQVDGPVDVSSSGHSFTGLATNLLYRVVVVAENGAGSSVRQATLKLGAFVDGLDGTLYHPATRLTWQKCNAGQTWSESGGCTGTAGVYQYCWEADDDCNGGVDQGLLGPPWLDQWLCPTCGGFSEAWDACDWPFAGRSDWRVPTAAELRALEANADPSAFPNRPAGLIWTANSTRATGAATDESDDTLKTERHYVRCVASGP